jgi:hypothetical protein
MKTKFFAVIASGTAAAVFCLAGACLAQSANAQTESAPAPAANDSAEPITPDEPAALPPNIDPASPLAQIIKLIQAGVSEDVIMAYVTNSTSLFNLDPDQIIYLKDIGAPDELVTAMMQRDEALKAQMTASGYSPAPQPAPATESTVLETTEAAAPPTVVTVDYFYSTLAPYGSWIYVEGYGRCWQPTVTVVNAGWQPYCDHGHWVWTDDGWFWLSDYSWGWATFHYGRWFHHARFGWCWVPDTVWGPSWVTWRYSTDYCGWAPLPPNCVYREGVGFFYNGVAVGVNFDFGLAMNWFTFVPTRYFCDLHPRRYRVEAREREQIFNRTTVINNFREDNHTRTFVNRGIDPDRITAVTRTAIHQVAIRETTERVPRGEQLGRDGRTLMVNRPHFTGNPPPNRREPPHGVSPGPGAGSPYQPARNPNENVISQPPRRYEPASPAPAPVQRPIPPAASSGSPGRGGVTPPSERSPSPGNRYAPVVPVQPQPPNYNSIDNRRYPSPRMQQSEPQVPRANPGNVPEVNRSSTPAQPPQRNYGAPVAAPSLRMQPSPPAQAPERIYVSPRNQTPPSESRPSYAAPPPAGNQSHAASAPSSPPAQSRSAGRDNKQNGH